MDLAALRTFVTVAEFGSFSRAAEALHVAQPAVSAQIKRLERDLRVQLFDRSTRRVQLTAAGQALLPRAQLILGEAERAQTEARLMSAGLTGRVALGFVGTATYSLLPQVVRAVRAQLPSVELEVFGEQLTPSLAADLAEHRLDIAVMRDPLPDPGLDLRPLRSERFVAALPADHRLAGEDSIDLAALAEDTFITHPSGRRSVTYDAVVQACAQAGFAPREVLEIRETATLVAFVAAGLGVALVPEPVRALALEGVVFRELSDVQATTALVVASQAGTHSPTAARVVELIVATAASPQPRTSARANLGKPPD